MLAHGHSLDTIKQISIRQRVELYQLYMAREAGPLADARLLHAIYQLITMIPKVMGGKAKDIEFEQVCPLLAEYSPVEATKKDPMEQLWSNLGAGPSDS